MKPSGLLFLIGLCGCVLQPVSRPSTPAVASESASAPLHQPASVATPAPEVKPAHVASVVEAYRTIERQEVPAVTAQDVTPEYIHRIHLADLAARQALLALERADRRPTLADLVRARDAVTHLASVLEEAPRGAP
jgi:hypothetical protein